MNEWWIDVLQTAHSFSNKSNILAKKWDHQKIAPGLVALEYIYQGWLKNIAEKRSCLNFRKFHIRRVIEVEGDLNWITGQHWEMESSSSRKFYCNVPTIKWITCCKQSGHSPARRRAPRGLHRFYNDFIFFYLWFSLINHGYNWATVHDITHIQLRDPRSATRWLRMTRPGKKLQARHACVIRKWITAVGTETSRRRNVFWSYETMENRIQLLGELVENY